MSDPFRLAVEGQREVERKLATMHARAADLKPLLDAIGGLLEASTKRRFHDGEGPDGTPWKPSRRAQATGGKTLLDSGRLRDSVVSEATGERVEIGTNLIYAPIHQLGGKIRPVNGAALHFGVPTYDGPARLPGGMTYVTVKEVVIPARPFLGISTTDMVQIEGMVEAYMDIEEWDDFLSGNGLKRG